MRLFSKARSMMDLTHKGSLDVTLNVKAKIHERPVDLIRATRSLES